MITSSKDILFITIAFCVLLLTVFLVWLLYYFIAIIRDVKRVVSTTEKIVGKIELVVDFVKKKVDSSTGHFVILAEAVKEIIKFASSKKTTGCKTAKKKAKK